MLDAWAHLQAAHHFHWMSAFKAPAMRRMEDANPYRDTSDVHARAIAALDRIEARLAVYGL